MTHNDGADLSKLMYDNVSSIFSHAGHSVRCIAEPFAWIKPGMLFLAKTFFGNNTTYLSMSNYHEKEYVDLFVNLMKMYGQYIANDARHKDWDMSGAAIQYALNNPAFKYAADIVEIISGMHIQFQKASHREAITKLAKESFIYLGVKQLCHTMPPFLPKGEIGDFGLIIEHLGWPYGARDAQILRSMFCHLKKGGHLVFLERPETVLYFKKNIRLGGKIIDPAEWGLKTPTMCFIIKKV